MKIPQTAPTLMELLRDWTAETAERLIHTDLRIAEGDYPHWEKLRRMPLPPGYSNHREWWMGIKIDRLGALTPVPGFVDKKHAPFQFQVPSFLQRFTHEFDQKMGGNLLVPDGATDHENTDRYIISSLIEESITSSQLEGAATTRAVARDMLRSQRPPRDLSEQMILNNYITMVKIQQLKDQALTPELVFDIHKLITTKTLENPDAAGRLRTATEAVDVRDDYGTVYHAPPPADELAQRLNAMCAFANGHSAPGAPFIHPTIRAIILHFWLAYDHPFVDGNGRTARALFYWCMLHHGYWMFQFISISTILRKSAAGYGRAFLYTETDGNDLTYFILHQVETIEKAKAALVEYLQRKTREKQELLDASAGLDRFNPRQVALLNHARRNPGFTYTVVSHKSSHGIATQTARTDLQQLVQLGLLVESNRGRKRLYTVAPDFESQLDNLT